MPRNLNDSLAKLRGTSVLVSAVDAYQQYGAATTQLVFSDGTRLQFHYWRFIRNGKERVSSFDHRQQYGLPAPIDAIEELQKELNNRAVREARLDTETGDLIIELAERLRLHVFGFSGYEVWEIHFPDGTGQYSNHAKSVTPGS